MELSQSQLQTLKTDLNNSNIPEIVAFVQNPTPDKAEIVAQLYNVAASPNYFVWKTSVLEVDYTRLSGLDTDGTTVTNWSWTTFIGRSQGERDAWPRLFMGGQGCNPSLVNVRQAFSDIFSGAGGANQRTHLLAISRRLALKGEKLFSVATAGGTGQRGLAANPDTLSFEGNITAQMIIDTRGV